LKNFIKNYDGAREAYNKLMEIVPGHIETIQRFIGFERRRENYKKCEELYRDAIHLFKEVMYYDIVFLV